MATTQIFDYMVRWRLEYGYFTAGKSLVFLRIKEDDPVTAYYHMLVPNDVIEGEDELFYTAVTQVASFCLMTFQSKRRTNDWLDKATKANKATNPVKILQRWPYPYSGLEDEATDQESSQATSSSQISLPGDCYVDTSKVAVQPRNIELQSRSTFKEAKSIQMDDNNEDEDEDDVSRELARATPGGFEVWNKRSPAQSNTEDSGDHQTSSEPEGQIRQYCTQMCLLGLRRGWALDEECPNVWSHRKPRRGNRHPIDAADFARLVREQLGQNRDRDCEPLGKSGAKGALFQLTLAQYGYTFVGKGTLSRFVRHLRHEGNVYRRLERLQGEVVPVYLGNVDLILPYYLDGQEAVHMLLMSWVGEAAAKVGVPDLAREVRRTSLEVRGEGVVQGDEHDGNMLWSAERHRVMLVDFDRASFLPVAKHMQLLKLSGGKRKRLKEGTRGKA
jgi:hypothetical protein